MYQSDPPYFTVNIEFLIKILFTLNSPLYTTMLLTLKSNINYIFRNL